MKYPRHYLITAKIKYATPIDFVKTDYDRFNPSEPKYVAFVQRDVVAYDEADARVRFREEWGSYGEQSVRILTVQRGKPYDGHAHRQACLARIA